MAKQRKRRKQNIPLEESKKERFIRVVTPRVGKAVKAIRQIAYCAGNSYEHTDKQLAQIIDILDTARDALKDAYSPQAASESGFSFTE